MKNKIISNVLDMILVIHFAIYFYFKTSIQDNSTDITLIQKMVNSHMCPLHGKAVICVHHKEKFRLGQVAELVGDPPMHRRLRI